MAGQEGVSSCHMPYYPHESARNEGSAYPTCTSETMLYRAMAVLIAWLVWCGAARMGNSQHFTPSAVFLVQGMLLSCVDDLFPLSTPIYVKVDGETTISLH